MRVLKGKEKIGELKTIPITVDWDYLREEAGFRKEEEEVEIAAGKLLQLLSVLTIVSMVVYDLYQRNFLFLDIWKIDSLFDLVFWISFAVLIYSFYLLRDRKIFLDTLRTSELQKLRDKLDKDEKVDEIEITHFMDNELLNVLDEVINEHQHHFVSELLGILVKYPLIKRAIPRLGLKVEDFVVIAREAENEDHGHIEDWIGPMMLGAFTIALSYHFEKVGDLSMFLYFCKTDLKEILLRRNVYEKEVDALELWAQNNFDKTRFLKEFRYRSALKPTSTVNRAFTSRYSETLIRFSRDYTREVIKEGFTYSIGREKEMAQLIQLVEKGARSATILVGAPGVGKTTFLKSFAVRMVVEDVPKTLQDKRLVAFDFARAFAMSPNLEQFKERIEKVMEEVFGAGNIVLVIEDFDQLVNVRKEFAAEIIGLLVKAMDNYKLRIIATTTPEGYTKHIKPQQNLVALFNEMDFPEPSDEIALQILLDETPKLEAKYNLQISFDTLQKTIHLSHNFEFERVLPDKAIDILEEACARAHEQNLKFITEREIEELVSQKVGVNVGAVDKNESETLLKMEDKLHGQIIGQDQAVKAVASALRRSRAGLVSEKRPIASFLFFGPTGVGKTELAKAVTKAYYGDEKLMIRLDMSEYQEESNLERLIGSNNGDNFSGGYLTDAVRQKPFALILLDEIEKANARVLDLFLQILDEGNITDGLGRKIDFSNTIIIMTSNAASKEIADLIAAGKTYNEVYKVALPLLRSHFRVEFLNRFDKVIMFKPLLPIEVAQVANLLMKEEQKKLAEKGINLVYTQQLLIELAQEGYNPIYGARELRRVITDQIEDKLAQLILEKRIKTGDEVKIEGINKFVI